MRAAAPYRYDAWPKVGRAEASTLRRVARRLPSVATIAPALEALLGASAAIHARALEACPAGTLAESLADPLVAIVLDDGRVGARSRVAIEIDPWLAAVAIDRALGGSGGAAVPPPSTALSAAERGVLAFVAARIAAGTGFRVRGIVTTPGALIDAVGDRGSVTWPADVTLGDDQGVVRAWIGRDALEHAAENGTPPGATHALGALVVEVVVEGGDAMLAAADVGSLRAGDVVVLDHASVRPTSRRAIDGTARVRIRGARRTTWQCAIRADALHVTARDTALDDPSTKGRPMANHESTKDALDLAGDAPIELTVELARFTISLDELAAVRPGEVLLSGRPIGERVVLRAGDRAVALGELVDVDGEVGVRVLRIGDQA